MRYLIDANIFLNIALQEEKENACKEFLDEVSSGNIEAVTTLFHMDASAIVMENRGVEHKDIGNFYFEAYNSKGLEIVNTGLSSRMNALAGNEYSGFDDSLLLQAFNELEADKIVTYDEGFDQENKITPEEVLDLEEN